MTYEISDLPKRFASKIQVDEETGCWCWTASNTNGYGRYKHAGAMVPAHRFAFETLTGRVIGDLHSDHTCRNRSCVNPTHIELVTQAENNRRKDEALGIGAYANFCVNGHQYTPENTYWIPGIHARRDCKACIYERGRRRRERNAAKVAATGKPYTQPWWDLLGRKPKEIKADHE